MTNQEKTKKNVHFIESNAEFEKFYTVGATLGASVHAESQNRPVLKKCIHNVTRKGFLVKFIAKSKIPACAGGDELWKILWDKILNIEDHINLMKVFDVFESDTHYLVVTEELYGGELYDFFINERAVPEETCKYIMRQVLWSVHHLHERNVLHRDIKPENLVFRNGKNPHLNSLKQYELALIDFDTCKMLDIPTSRYCEIINGKRRLVGTYGYLAPEILNGYEYSEQSDIWSIGVIMYILMTGLPPVPMERMGSAKDSLAIFKVLEVEGIDFNVAPLPDFPGAQALIKRMLSFNPNCRPSCVLEILRDPWIYDTMFTLPNKEYNIHIFGEHINQFYEQQYALKPNKNINNAHHISNPRNIDKTAFIRSKINKNFDPFMSNLVNNMINSKMNNLALSQGVHIANSQLKDIRTFVGNDVEPSNHNQGNNFVSEGENQVRLRKRNINKLMVANGRNNTKNDNANYATPRSATYKKNSKGVNNNEQPTNMPCKNAY